MAYYDDELVEQVRDANNIVDVINSYVKLTKKGSNHVGLCPFHNEKTGSFSVSESKQMYHCFGCGAGGNVFTFLREYENFSFQESMEYLAGRAGIQLPVKAITKEQKKEADERQLLLEMNREAATYFYKQLREPNGNNAMKYLLNRELTNETIHKFGLGYSNKTSNDLYQFLKKKGYSDLVLKDSGLVTIDEKKGAYDKFWNRVMFPIMDANSHVVGFGGRVMGEGEPKYLNSPETKVFDKSRNLYGLNIARTSRRKGFLLCEGYMDVIALHQAGFDNAIASLGTAFTQGHANLMKRYVKEVYLTFDSDAAGVKAALRAIPILKESGLVPKIIHMEPYKDPDDYIKAMGAEAFGKQIEQAENAFLFQIRKSETQYDFKDPQSKTEFQKNIILQLLTFNEEIERSNYMDMICDFYGFPRDSMMKLMSSLSSQMPYRPEQKISAQQRKEKKKPDDSTLKPQQLLLTWLTDEPEIYSTVSKYIQIEDFIDPLMQQAAIMVYEQLDKEKLNPAGIIDAFQQEQQGQIAELFSTQLQKIETKQEKEKALKDIILRIKTNRYEKTSSDVGNGDLTFLTQLVEQKKRLEELQKIDLHLSER